MLKSRNINKCQLLCDIMFVLKKNIKKLRFGIQKDEESTFQCI